MKPLQQIRQLLRPFIPSNLRPWKLAVNDLSSNLGKKIDIDEQPTILAGPFVGMLYVTKSIGSVWEPKILGTYECELHRIIEKLKVAPFDLIINVGAAEGYYAIGLARERSAKKIVAYETSEIGRSLIRQLAELNNVSDIVEVRGTCTSEQILADLKGALSPLVVMDVEGAEMDLLAEIDAEILHDTTVLIELHEQSRPGCTAVLTALFGANHSVEVVLYRPRSIADLAMKSKLLAELVLCWTDELRTDGKAWLYAIPTGRA